MSYKIIHRKPIWVIIINIVLICALIASFLVAVFTNHSEETIDDVSNEISPSISVYDLSVHAPQDTIIINGVIDSKSKTEINTDITSPVSELYIAVGDIVKKGDVLCIFDTSEIESEIYTLERAEKSTSEQEHITHEINQRELINAINDKERLLKKAYNDIVSAREDIDAIETKIESAEIKYQNMADSSSRSSYLDDDTSDEDDTKINGDEADELTTEEYEAKINELNDELKSAENKLKECQSSYDDTAAECDRIIQSYQNTIDEEVSEQGQNTAELTRLKEQLKKSTIIAPQNGIITELNLSKGVSAKDEKIICIADMNSASVKTQIPEDHIFSIFEGMNVLISLPMSDGKIINSTVSEIITVPVINESLSENADEYSGFTKNYYTAYIDLPKDEKWIYGMSLETAIISKDKKYIHDIPTEYIENDKNGDYIFIADKTTDDEYTAVKKYIYKGNEYPESNTVEIYFNGITSNTKIIKSNDDVTELKDGEILPDGIFDKNDNSDNYVSNDFVIE